MILRGKLVNKKFYKVNLRDIKLKQKKFIADK